MPVTGTFIDFYCNGEGIEPGDIFTISARTDKYTAGFPEKPVNADQNTPGIRAGDKTGTVPDVNGEGIVDFRIFHSGPAVRPAAQTEPQALRSGC